MRLAAPAWRSAERNRTEITAQIFSRNQIEATIDADELPCHSSQPSGARDHGMDYLERDPRRISSRMELSLENRSERVAVGRRPVGVSSEGACQQVKVMNQPFVKVPDVCPGPVKGDNDLNDLGIIGRCRRLGKPVESGFEWDWRACLRQD